jgi:hypothetical protein
LVLAGCSGERAPFQPGQWEFKIETAAEGQRVFWGGGGQCVDRKEAANLPAVILGNTAFGQCTESRSRFAGGKFEVSAACDGKSAATTMPASKVSLQGSSSETTFEAKLSARLEGETPATEISGELSAHRTGDCSESKPGNGS